MATYARLQRKDKGRWVDWQSTESTLVGKRSEPSQSAKVVRWWIKKVPQNTIIGAAWRQPELSEYKIAKQKESHPKKTEFLILIMQGR